MSVAMSAPSPSARIAHVMALRTFTDRTGCAWNCWNVQSPTEHIVAHALRGGWLCFQRECGGERFRLGLNEVPPAWEQLADERLDLLRRVAEAGTRDDPDVARISDESVSSENRARRRTSGPRSAISDSGESSPI